jgi:hypothetical protein
VGFFYKFPNSVILDEGVPSDLVHQIQGMSIAACYDRAFLSCKGTYSLAGTITEAVGAEFVNVHCEDTDAADAARPGELIIGILVDAVPPFDGQYLPPTDDFLKLICVDFQVLQTAPCKVNGQPAKTVISFCDGANGKGKVPVRNLASVANHSWPMAGLSGAGAELGGIEVQAEAAFVRGDCNFSQIDHVPSTGKDAVDISDAAAVISYLFQTDYFQFQPPCLDACDANDDGRVDLADSVYILRYLFKFDKQPPEPFDNSPGPDPTKDRLSCEGGSICQ